VDKNLAYRLRCNGCPRTDCRTMVVCDIRLLLFVLLFMNPFAPTPLLLQFWRRLHITAATSQRDVYWLDYFVTSRCSDDVRKK
jgi:hypothetical protein